MEPKVSIIMGSTSDMPIMEGAAKILDQFERRISSAPAPMLRMSIFCWLVPQGPEGTVLIDEKGSIMRRLPAALLP